jgi:ribosomal protein S18 acetylase RimI-like enzyme
MNGFSFEDAVAKIEEMIDHLTNGTAMVYGTFDQKDLIGFVWAYEHPFREETRIYISEIHVDERYRGRGIGKQLLTAVESMARSRGYKALYIHAEGDKDDVIRLYQQEGYVIERVQLRKGL